MARRGPKEITDQHKAAMATGRTQGRVIKNYLDALEQNRPRRGRRRTVESITTRLSEIDAELDEGTDPVSRLSLVQERIDLGKELDVLSASRSAGDMAELQAAFVEVAAAYSTRRGISYAAWREVGVPAAVLRSAGVPRGS
jgi:hypothetical protein